jgi:arsenate reductase
MKEEKLRILFLCTGNSCRSQMAEAWTHHLKSDLFSAFSAGVEPKGVDPRAVKSMAEVDIDISGQISKGIESLNIRKFDFVVTLCDHANEACPFFPGKTRRIHRAFDDSPKLAAGAATEEAAMEFYRRVRDEIRTFVEKFPFSLDEADND